MRIKACPLDERYNFYRKTYKVRRMDRDDARARASRSRILRERRERRDDAFCSRALKHEWRERRVYRSERASTPRTGKYPAGLCFPLALRVSLESRLSFTEYENPAHYEILHSPSPPTPHPSFLANVDFRNLKVY